MAKVIKTRGPLPGTGNLGFLQNLTEGFLQANFPVICAFRIWEERYTLRHNSRNIPVALTEHICHIVGQHNNSAPVLLALQNVQSAFCQIHISYTQPPCLCRTQAAAIEQLHHGRNHKVPYWIIAAGFEMIQHIPNSQYIFLRVDIRSIRCAFSRNIGRKDICSFPIINFSA